MAYTKQTWTDGTTSDPSKGTVITASKMEHIEEGIDELNQSLTDYAPYVYLESPSEIATKLSTSQTNVGTVYMTSACANELLGLSATVSYRGIIHRINGSNIDFLLYAGTGSYVYIGRMNNSGEATALRRISTENMM